MGLTTLGGIAELGFAADDDDDEDDATGGALGARFFDVVSGFDVGVVAEAIAVRVLLLTGIARGTGADASRRTGAGAAEGTALFAADPVTAGDDGDAAAGAADDDGGTACALGSGCGAFVTGDDGAAVSGVTASAGAPGSAPCSASPFSPLKSFEKIPILRSGSPRYAKLRTLSNVCLLRLCRRCERSAPRTLASLRLVCHVNAGVRWNAFATRVRRAQEEIPAATCCTSR
jgi:hypothetical protein